MGIILAILKIVGVVLLAVLGLLILLTVLILLVPVRYRLEASFDEAKEGLGKPRGLVRITWLLHLLSVTLFFGTEGAFCLRLLGIRILPGRRKNTEPVEGRETETAPAEHAAEDVREPGRALPSEESVEEPTGEQTSEAYVEDAAEEHLSEEGDVYHACDEPCQEDAAPEAGREKGAEGRKEPLSVRIGRMCRRMAAWFAELTENTERAMNRLTEKVERMRKTCSWYLGLLGGEDARHLAGKALRLLKKILNHVKPRQIRADLEIGTGDPASTGNIFAILGVLYPVMDRRARFTPDFERKRLVGFVRIKGRVQAGLLFFCGLRMIADRRLWKLIRQLKKGGNI